MRIVREFPRRVREIENAWITLSDGCRLAARIWLPEDAESDPVPAILEYLPYRKRDGTAERDALTQPYFAGHGYACLRVDMRGNGESDGLMLDEYLKQEQDDALEAIAWAAAQPWCTGKVGMMGISWGGFNGLQVAARRPEALKAIITLCSTDDRYADDIHYRGGCLLGDNLAWASTMFAFSSRPPDPALVGERWRELWLERLESTPLLVENWLRHQHRDAFWKHGSVCEDYSAITCAVYAIGGWADGYSNAIPRMLEKLRCPRKGLIGPWAHKYPHIAKPGPAIGFLQEALRWWDHWLKGIDTGIMDEPMYRAWLQESVRPKPHYAERPGRWVAEPSWPSPNLHVQRLALNGRGLEQDPGPETPLVVRSPIWLGLAGGDWCAHGLGPDLPFDQRFEDGAAVCFDSEPLGERLEILGAPVAELELEADRPCALVCVRLCDVAPDGASSRVTYGLLNLTHRDGHEHPRPLEPGRRYRVGVQLDDIGHAFPAGHRMRVAVSNAYWPIVWPSREPVSLMLYGGRSHLELPVRPPRAEDAALRPFDEPEGAEPWRITQLSHASTSRRVEHAIEAERSIFETHEDSGRYRIEPHGLEVRQICRARYEVGAEDPCSARVTIHWTTERGRGAWQVRVETKSVMTVTKDAFHIAATLEAFENERRVYAQVWNPSIPRALV